jgi:hypothetical protein
LFAETSASKEEVGEEEMRRIWLREINSSRKNLTGRRDLFSCKSVVALNATVGDGLLAEKEATWGREYHGKKILLLFFVKRKASVKKK